MPNPIDSRLHFIVAAQRIPLSRLHQASFGLPALESEPVDPRLQGLWRFREVENR